MMLLLSTLLIAQEGGGGSTGVPVELIQYGVLGVILVLMLFGWLWAKPSVDRIIKDKEAAEKQRDELLALYQRDVIPVLVDVRDKIVPVLAEIRAEMQRRE